MNKRSIFASLLVVLLLAWPATGAPLELFADQMFQSALDELLPVFRERTGFDVRLTSAPSAALVEQIQSGAVVDVFFPAGEAYMRNVMGMGLVDVALKRNVLQLTAAPSKDGSPDPVHTSAAVLNHATQRIAAMAFLDFLTADDARAVFARQGFSLP